MLKPTLLTLQIGCKGILRLRENLNLQPTD